VGYKQKINYLLTHKIKIIFFIFFTTTASECYSVFFEKININGFVQSYKCLISTDGFTYLGTDNGLYKYDGFNNFKFDEILDPVYDIHEDYQRSIVIITDRNKMAVKKNRSLSFENIPLNRNSLIVNMFLREDSNYIYYQLNDAKLRLCVNTIGRVNKKNYNFEYLELTNTLQTQSYSYFFLDSTFILQKKINHLYFYLNQTKNKLIIYDKIKNTKENYTFEQINKISYVNNNLFIHANSGIYEYKFSNKKINLAYKIKNSTCIDVKNEFIIITTLDGIYQLSNRVIPIKNLSQLSILDFCQIENSTFALSSNSNVYKSKNFGKFNLIDKSAKIYNSKISSFDNVMILNGKIYYKNSTSKYTSQKYISHINHLICDTLAGQKKFIGISNIAACDYNATISKYNILFYGPKLVDIKFQNEHLYVASRRGLYIFPSLEFKKQNLLNSPTDLANIKINDLEKIKNEFLLVLGFNKIYIYKNGLMLKNFTITENKTFEFSKMIVFKNKFLITSSFNGFMVYKISNLPDKSISLKKLYFITLPNTLNSTSIISNISCGIEMIFISTNSGVFSYLPNENSLRTLPKFIAAKIYTNNQRNIIINDSETTNLSLNTTSIHYRFEFIDYNSNNIYKQQFRYRLISNDTSNWIYFNSKEFNIINLTDGKFTLQLQHFNHILEWVDIANQNFYIPLVYYKKKPFIILFLTILSLIILTSFYYVILIRKRKTDAENYIIRNKNYELELLKSQMNPHFIYNALNSVKAIFYLNQNLAISYIDDLAIFFRSILTIENHILISKEIEIANSYIRIENSRLNNKISFKINIPFALENLLIPCNILQPILENAIKYGEYSKNEKTLTIILNIQDINNIIEITVTNDGRLINSLNNHQSFATDNIKKRLNLFNSGKIQNCFEIKNEENHKTVSCTIKLIKIHENTYY
jgi:sensor histidine kinase YesM